MEVEEWLLWRQQDKFSSVRPICLNVLALFALTWHWIHVNTLYSYLLTIDPLKLPRRWKLIQKDLSKYNYKKTCKKNQNMATQKNKIRKECWRKHVMWHENLQKSIIVKSLMFLPPFCEIIHEYQFFKLG